ncbi:MAG: hypothetical protein Q9213_001382 [Squamulea squamosa]
MGLLFQQVTSDDDFNELIECEWTSYETPYNGFKEIYCPTLGTGPNAREESMNECRERQLADHKADATSHWFKVVDSNSGQIVGGAQWNIYHENPYVNGVGHIEATWWPEGEGRKFASMGMDQWFAPRGKRMNKPHILLALCFVHPAHRRRGAGSLLLKWGTQKADELDLDTFIEAARPGIPLYLTHGFKEVEEYWIDPKIEDPSEEWKQLKEKIPPIPWMFMWRPKQGRFEEGKTYVIIHVAMTRAASAIPQCKFPSHSEPRVWLLSSGTSPIAIALSRQLLAHGDFVVFGTKSSHASDTLDCRAAEFTIFWTEEVLIKEEWKNRARIVGLDGRNMSQCRAAVAETVALFQRLDVLFCCSSQAIVGSVEELGSSSRTSGLIRDQFETNYFGQVNIIKAALPSMRESLTGHIILLSGITGHLGTPGLGMYCASQWAMEGFCDSLAYEVAPFNVKMTIVQPNLEINILTNEITVAPQLPQYAPENNAAPLFREIIGGLLDRVNVTSTEKGSSNGHAELGNYSSDSIVSVYPQLPEQTKSPLLAETVNALAAIGGHDNPPARHIVGHEAVASVKEKLKTVSEELEDFVEVSCAVDFNNVMDGITRTTDDQEQGY